MCLIAFNWQPGSATPLLLAANRDEFYARPSAPLAPWSEAPQLFAGRDLQAGGTWLGITQDGRFAALTNIRDLSLPQGERSRGELVTDYLLGRDDPASYLSTLRQRLDGYGGFNLLLGDGQALWHFNSRERQPRKLPAGLYGLSNASLDTPWPKLVRLREALREQAGQARTEQLLALLTDEQQPADAQLPDTGIGLERERMLGRVFIRSAHYGTRASTVLRVEAGGHWQICERRFGPEGRPLGEVSYSR